MSAVISLVLGLPILVAGLVKRRRAAIIVGAVLCLLALSEIAIVAYLLWQRRTPPDIGVHAIVLVPIAIALAIQGARALR